jgi:hypothetical protein
MPLSHRPLDALTEADLQGLVTSGVREGRRIEYKRQLPGTSDDDKREFLADVCSFANASGGDVLYGVAEEAGLPTGSPGVQESDLDAATLRLENIIRSGIEPRLPGVHLTAIPVAGAAVIAIRVPQSWALPHVVSFKNYSRFYSRTSAGKYQLDVTELRALFARSAAAADRIRRFRDERLARIIADEGPFPTPGPARAILHVVPARLFDPSVRLDLADMQALTANLFPLFTYSFNQRYNLDGFVTYTSADGVASSYLQFFRSGAVEAVECGMLKPNGRGLEVPGALIVRELVERLPLYFEVLRQRGVDLPLAVMITRRSPQLQARLRAQVVCGRRPDRS